MKVEQQKVSKQNSFDFVKVEQQRLGKKATTTTKNTKKLVGLHESYMKNKSYK